MANFLTRVFGSRNQRLLREYSRVVNKINALEEGIKALDDAALLARTADFKQRYAAGDYPNQRSPEVVDGLPAYVAGDRSLDNRSLTVWYTLNQHHVVRPEDWPVMPVGYIGFHLKPFGFFDQNPAINLPPAHAKQCQEVK